MWAYLKNKTRTIPIEMAKYWHKKMYQPLPFYKDLGWYTKLFTDHNYRMTVIQSSAIVHFAYLRLDSTNQICLL